MATALYRLGRWCAAHAWRVIAGWVVVLVALAAGAAGLGTAPTSEISIPGSEFQKVLDQLGREIPAAAGGVGTVVFRSNAGAFTPAQQSAITGVLDQWKTLPKVKTVQDPFANQKNIDEGATQLADAKTQLDAAAAQLRQGRSQLDAAQGQLTAGRAVLADLVRTNPQDPQIPALEKQLADGSAQLAAKEKDYAAGKAGYDTGLAQYRQGVAKQQMLDGMRFVSSDGRYAVAQIQFDGNVHSVPQTVRDQIPAIGSSLASAGVHPDYSVEITQDTKLIGPGEVLGLVVAAIVLIAMLGTLIAAGLPLSVALLGVGVGLAGAVAATAAYDMNTMTPSLALMLGLAVGIDYALFIVNRHRSQLLRGMELHESIGRAVGTAGNAVIFAGTTVVIALTALVVSGIPILAQMGLVAAATVAVTVLVAITVSPAILALMRSRVVSRRAWRKAGFATAGDRSSRHADARDGEHGAWYVALVTARPWLTILGVIVVVGIIALPAGDLRLGLPDGGQEPVGSTAYTAYTEVADHFGPGMNGPVIAVATLPGGTTSDQAAARQVEIGTSLSRQLGVRSVVPVGESADHTTLAFQLILTTGPADAATVDTVQMIKDSAPAIGMDSGSTVSVTGQTVANIEISQRLGAALPIYLALVVGLSLLILMVVFRSVVVPLVATGGFLLSVAASFGATVAVYQWGWLGSLLQVQTPGPILSFMPIILIGVLFGLAMDYQMFLVSGMHEAYAHGEDSRTAVRSGFIHGAKVVTAAAVIMTSVFGGFVFAHLTMIRPIGLGLAVGVLVDAVLVRMTLTPALMHLLGRRAWWMPARLQRITPDLDVEGTGLTAHLAAVQRPTPDIGDPIHGEPGRKHGTPEERLDGPAAPAPTGATPDHR
jgi:RND superfamily putative drug exporter